MKRLITVSLFTLALAAPYVCVDAKTKSPDFGSCNFGKRIVFDVTQMPIDSFLTIGKIKKNSQNKPKVFIRKDLSGLVSYYRLPENASEKKSDRYIKIADGDVFTKVAKDAGASTETNRDPRGICLAAKDTFFITLEQRQNGNITQTGRAYHVKNIAANKDKAIVSINFTDMTLTSDDKRLQFTSTPFQQPTSIQTKDSLLGNIVDPDVADVATAAVIQYEYSRGYDVNWVSKTFQAFFSFLGKLINVALEIFN